MSSSVDRTTEQLVRLESKLAYQDKLLLDLNEVIVEQGRSIQELAKRLEAVEQFLRSVTEGETLPEKPPHY